MARANVKFLAKYPLPTVRTQSMCRCGVGEPSPRCRCGSGEPSPGADVAGMGRVSVQIWEATWMILSGLIASISIVWS